MSRPLPRWRRPVAAYAGGRRPYSGRGQHGPAAEHVVSATASSTGQAGTGAGWLDLHFAAARPEYQAQLRAVGLQPGWHVLDAGCGSGSFLPWLAELVGPSGSLAALDLASDNVALVERRLAAWAIPCPVEARVGSVLALPYPDHSFDAVWCANTTVYLSDAELETALTELRRVVRPGGLVAVKDIDSTLDRLLPGPPGLWLRRLQGVAATSGAAAGRLRAAALPGWLRQAGLVAVWRRTTLMERSSPFDPATRAFLRAELPFVAGAAPGLALPPADQEVWACFRDPALLERYLDDPASCVIEGNILAVGTVPDGA